jgi:formate dehydrogenase subunit gamma
VVQIIADRLNITRADVHGVISFYHDFRDAPANGHIVKICRAEACQAVGANVLSQRALEKNLAFIGAAQWRTGLSQSKRFFALACGPAAMIDNKVVGRVDAAKLDKLLAEAGA